MKTASKQWLACFALILLVLHGFASPSRAETEKRIAFVVGNAAYPAGQLSTPANDAGLIAQTLQAAGFDVTGARDLDGESLRAAFRDFLDKAQASGPDTVAFIYLAGYGLQFEGENYFVPVDAKIPSPSDVAVEALRISDYTKRLAGLALKASFIVLDAARDAPFAKSGPSLAGGLALGDAEPNMLLAFNAAPGSVAPIESGPYGVYARALTEMIREGGLPAAEVFDGLRLRVNEETKGALVPWDASRISAPFVFFVRAADAPPSTFAADRVDAMRSQPLRELGAQNAYAAAIERDTMQGYLEFLAAYPDDPLANRVRALLAARREALTWQRTCHVNTPDAYWSYLNRYRRGPHVYDARRRLETFAVAEEPPPSFTPIVYDVPPPPPVEIVYVDRPVLVFDDPEFGFAPPPPPVIFLAPPPAYLVFPPPPPPVELFVLPVPAFVPVPAYFDPPAYVAPPPGNVIFTNIHNTTIINNTANVINPAAPPVQGAPGAPMPAAPGAVSAGAGVAAGVAAGAIAAKVALPPSVARKAAISGGQPAPGITPVQPAPMQGAPGGRPGAVPSGLPPGHESPGVAGKPIPTGPGQRPGTLPGQPGAAPAASLPPGHELRGAPSKPLQPGAGQKPGMPPGQPGAAPATGLPPGHELPGMTGKPPGPTQKPPATTPQNSQPVHALPSGQGLQPLTGKGGPSEGMKPGPIMPQGGSPQKSPQVPGRGLTGQPPPNRLAPSGSSMGTGPGPAGVSRAQQYRPPPPPQQTYRPPPPPQQTYRPPPPPQQQANRPPPPPQQANRPQQQRTCGLPGLPPCPR